MSEIGIPFDLDKRAAYKTGDYSNQIRALDASLNACDGPNMLNSSIWTYCPDNTHPDGDRWNGEDLSLWSHDDQERNRGNLIYDQSTSSFDTSSSAVAKTPTMPPTPSSSRYRVALESQSHPSPSHLDLNDGARALPAFCRPYPTATFGTPIKLTFDLRTSEFLLEIQVGDDDVDDQSLATEIYIPLVHYAAAPSEISQQVKTHLNTIAEETSEVTTPLLGDKAPLSASLTDLLSLDVEISSGTWETKGQTLFWYYGNSEQARRIRTETITIKRRGGAIPLWVEMYGRPRGVLSTLTHMVRSDSIASCSLNPTLQISQLTSCCTIQ